ncbi:MAG: hypothetical protein CLLPBCKN_007558 [Chroococcidiopsis cubana SAG 39.79]|uniref:Uncharacterized protein n=1 Tax=Chroococcidiopsis cubana SAG 39.79 TaxID=388085 RepID=A0AB37UUH2_9CYAN|nr:hypothetical protein [Chroococcidiopsis cubana]MDZ4878123.1 hypothetical protein [Chroococcidiopsis cubana SAG 39.79]PSB54377.1 hypothetical protein C7B79_34950 [Chroococcidiopsis cubana CCALA 043]RUT14609.1 hypothetical protein DSM107010_01550 [Chroococcidiopsis cubana SAG 39.79]
MVNLEGLSDEQLAVISKACELLARLYMGQLEEVAWLFNDRLPVERYQELDECLNQLKPVITELSSSQHLGINSALVPDLARNAYDIHACIQYHLASTGDPSFTIRRSPPQPCGSFQLPICQPIVESKSA